MSDSGGFPQGEMPFVVFCFFFFVLGKKERKHISAGSDVVVTGVDRQSWAELNAPTTTKMGISFSFELLLAERE